MPEQRHLKLYAPVLEGDSKLSVARLRGHEGLSQAFRYEVILLSRDASLDFDRVLGQEMCIALELPGGEERYIHGYVASFARVGSEGVHTRYRAELRPHLWRLTQATDCRIFQGETVPNIVQSILKDHRIQDVETAYGKSNRGPFLAWEYCVQYRETDFAFVSRLLEHEGIHYFFKHEKQRHVLVLADSNSTHQFIPGYEEVEYRPEADHEWRGERIWNLSLSKSVLPGRVIATDYDFKLPSLQLLDEAGSEVERTHPKARATDYEVYDHLEAVVQQSGYVPNMIEQYARMRTEELHVWYELIRASSDARGLCAGTKFKLVNASPAQPAAGPSKNTDEREYLILSTELVASTASRASAASTEGSVNYVCRIEAIDIRHPYRPPRLTPKPLIAGLQSATVVGGSGGPFWTNEHGQIRVKFHWDRSEEKDQRASCWVRVAQASAGSKWGSWFLPHVGHEVLVSFLEGDPDRPIVVGSVYNGNNQLPVKTPVNGHLSVMRDVAGNQIVMDAKPGKEDVQISCPNNHSVVKLGKHGITTFTRKKQASYSYDSESYHLGKRTSYTRGYTFNLNRGPYTAIRTTNIDIRADDLKAVIGAAVDLKVGTSFAFALNHSFSYSAGREEKLSKGVARLFSKDDALLESLKTAYVSGGSKDQSLIKSSDHELVLSYDSNSPGRKAEMDAADRLAKNVSRGAIVPLIGVGGLGGAWYATDVSSRGPEHNRDCETVEMNAELDRLTGLNNDDLTLAGLHLATVSSTLFTIRRKRIANPEHDKPSAKIVLKNDLIRLFAGTSEETKLELHRDRGMSVAAKRSVSIASDESVQIRSKAELTVRAQQAVVVQGAVRHRNLTILR